MKPVFEVYNLGDDSTIARHGIHGLHQLFSIDTNSYLLVHGDITVYLKQVVVLSHFVALLTRVLGEITHEIPLLAFTGLFGGELREEEDKFQEALRPPCAHTLVAEHGREAVRLLCTRTPVA